MGGFLFFQFIQSTLVPFLLTFVDVSLGLGTVRLVMRHDIDFSAYPGSVIVIDSRLSLRVRLGSYNARTGQVIFADVTRSRRVVSGHGFNVLGNTAQGVGDGVLDVRLAVESVVAAERIVDPLFRVWFGSSGSG